MNLGDRISKYRKQKGMTIDDLAEKSGVPKGTLNKIIAGTTKAPTLETIRSIAYALDLTLNDFDDASSASIHMSSRDQEHIKKYQSLNETGKDDVDKYTDYVMSNPANLATAPQTKVVHQEIAAKGIDVKSREIEVDPKSIRKSRGKMILHILEDEENQ